MYQVQRFIDDVWTDAMQITQGKSSPPKKRAKVLSCDDDGKEVVELVKMSRGEKLSWKMVVEMDLVSKDYHYIEEKNCPQMAFRRLELLRIFNLSSFLYNCNTILKIIFYSGDSGAFMLYYMDQLMHGKKMTFSGGKQYRRKILEILMGFRNTT